jgi:regulatory protein
LKGSHADAKSCALKFLSYRSRSRKELFDKLKRKGFSNGQIDHTIRFLEAAGLIDDQNLAGELFAYSLERKPLGKKGIEAFLSRRGIGKELIHRTLSVHTGDMEQESANRFVEKKLRSLKSYPEDVVKRRLWGMLRRRGFSAEAAQKAIGSIRI